MVATLFYLVLTVLAVNVLFICAFVVRDAVSWLRAQLYRIFSDPEPYPPEAAEAPPLTLDEHFKTAPGEQRIDRAEVDRLVEQFDWPRYATWLKEPS